MKYSIFLLVLVSFLSCKKKNTDPLPPATHNGANTMGFYVNGSPRSTSGSPSFLNGSGVKFHYGSDSSIRITASSSNSPRWDIYMAIIYHDTLGTYPSNGNYPAYIEYSDFSSGSTLPTGSTTYTTDGVGHGQITISACNRNFGPCAGTFSFDAVNDSGQVIHVTDGRFDISN